MLYSHVLDKTRVTIKNFAVDILKYETLRNLNPSQNIAEFVTCPVETSGSEHFQTRNIGSLWALYDAVNPLFKLEHPYFERDQRRRFTRQPTYVAVLEDKVVSGLWTDGPMRDRDATIHIITRPEYRGKGIASAVLDVMEADIKSRFSTLRCCWDPRPVNPALLFRKHGYKIVEHKHGGEATKKL